MSVDGVRIKRSHDRARQRESRTRRAWMLRAARLEGLDRRKRRAAGRRAHRRPDLAAALARRPVVPPLPKRERRERATLIIGRHCGRPHKRSAHKRAERSCPAPGRLRVFASPLGQAAGRLASGAGSSSSSSSSWLSPSAALPR
jgi:hypothetical protein